MHEAKRRYGMRSDVDVDVRNEPSTWLGIQGGRGARKNKYLTPFGSTTYLRQVIEHILRRAIPQRSQVYGVLIPRSGVLIPVYILV